MNKIKVKGYWTKENCLVEAKKYKTKNDWNINSTSSSQIARKNGWFEECCKHMVPVCNWSEKKCIKDAKKYATRTEWWRISSGAASAAKKNNWIEKCCKHMPNGYIPRHYWTKKECLIEARKHKTITAWNKVSINSRRAAFKNGWGEECCKHMTQLIKPKGYWTKEKCIEESKKYKTKKEWQEKAGSCAFFVRRNGWLDECTKHMEKKFFWTEETCINEAQKYTSRRDWAYKASGSLSAAKKNNWFDKCVKHMVRGYKTKCYWTKEKCIKEAKKYKTRGEWFNKSGGSLHFALRNNLFDECSKHMVIRKNKPIGYWTKEKCMDDAKKYIARSEWWKKSGGAYNAAKSNDWFEGCVKHMPKIYSIKTNKIRT